MAALHSAIGFKIAALHYMRRSGLPLRPIGFVFRTPFGGPISHNSFSSNRLRRRAANKNWLCFAPWLVFVVTPQGVSSVPPAGQLALFVRKPPCGRVAGRLVGTGLDVASPKLASFGTSHFKLRTSDFSPIGFVWRDSRRAAHREREQPSRKCEVGRLGGLAVGLCPLDTCHFQLATPPKLALFLQRRQPLDSLITPVPITT